MNDIFTTSQQGVDLIKKYEGFRSHPYRDAVGVPTIGYGATHYPNGNKVKITDRPITEEQAEVLLIEMLKEYENTVKRLVTSKLNQRQFDALVSFTYNLGGANLSRSTLLKKINNDPCDIKIKTEFKRWVRAGGKVLNGLKRRRNEEADLYFS